MRNGRPKTPPTLTAEETQQLLAFARSRSSLLLTVPAVAWPRGPGDRTTHAQRNSTRVSCQLPAVSSAFQLSVGSTA